MRATVELRGLEEVAQELRRRGLDVQAGLERICHAGATVVREAAEDLARGDVEILQETTAKRGPRVEVSVGPHRRNHIARYLEYGTKAHRLPKARKRGRRKPLVFAGVFRAWANHPGARKRPYLRPAFDYNQTQAQAAMAHETKKTVRA